MIWDKTIVHKTRLRIYKTAKEAVTIEKLFPDAGIEKN
jgi:hypothetical protein